MDVRLDFSSWTKKVHHGRNEKCVNILVVSLEKEKRLGNLHL